MQHPSDRLTAALNASEPLDAIRTLAAEHTDDLLPAIRDRYLTEPADRHYLSRLLGMITSDGSTAVMLELLDAVGCRDAVELLRPLACRAAVVPVEQLRRLIADKDAVADAIAAAGVAGHESLVPVLRKHLGRKKTRAVTALALGRMRATPCTGDIARQLPKTRRDALEHDKLVVALELMGDPAAVPALRRWLRRAPKGHTYSLHHALRALTGRDPLIGESARSIRSAWSSLDLSTTPTPRIHWRLADPTRATATVHDGTGLLAIDFDPPPSPNPNWPRWSRSLRVAGRPLYRVGSVCGTCETVLYLSGWPRERAAMLSARLRHWLADVPELTEQLLDDARPLLGALRTGPLLITLADLDLELVTEPSASWFARRQELRASEDRIGTDWPGTPHLQLRHRIPGPKPTFCSVLPATPLDALDESTITSHASAVEAGSRPAAVLLTWAEDRDVHLEYPERYLVNVVLDGHHKLGAYTRLGVPARALLVGRVADSTGPAKDRARYLREMVEPLRVKI